MSELPDHDALHAAAMRRMEWEARAVREVGRSYEREEGKVATSTGVKSHLAAIAERDYWNEVAGVIGQGWKVYGWNYCRNATFRAENGAHHDVEGVVAERLLELAKGDQSNEGAQAERDAVRAYLKRRRGQYTFHENWRTPQEAANTQAVLELERILEWLDGRSVRFTKTKGGLQGRRRAAKGKGGKGGGKGAK
jgi:hypothetical protein